jgi:hypothetical protein
MATFEMVDDDFRSQREFGFATLIRWVLKDHITDDSRRDNFGLFKRRPVSECFLEGDFSGR